MNYPPIRETFDTNNEPSIFWVRWIQELFGVASLNFGSGPTSTRPTVGLKVGAQYYDTTLGLPIFVHTTNPIVWHRADGTVA